MPRERRGLLVSLALHLVAMAALLLFRGTPPEAAPAAVQVKPPTRIVSISVAGPAGGGGGGGARQPEPVQQLQAPGRDALSVAVRKPVLTPPRTIAPDPPPTPALDIPAVPLAAAMTLAMGVIEAPPGLTGSQGAGSGDGADGVEGKGAGPGGGDGLGPGRNRGFGDGAHSIGSGVTAPLLVHSVKPRFTSEAMTARVSGIALLDCVVNADGSVGECRIARSIDRRYGLDDQALQAVRQWRFKPGMLQGTPVPVLVRVELAFSLY